MAYTLKDLMVDCYFNLGQLNRSVATGGSTATVVDSLRTSSAEEGSVPNTWRYGPIFIDYDAAGLGAAPQGEMASIVSFASSTGTFTFAALTAAVAAGDEYSYAGEYYPLLAMIKAANDGLRDLGMMKNVDTSLTFASGTLTYDLPVVAKRVHKVEVLNTDEVYIEVKNWTPITTVGGTVGKLEFTQNLPHEDTMRVHYYGAHPTLRVYNSTVNELLDPELVMLATLNKAMEWQNSRAQGTMAFDLQKWNDIKMQYAAKKAELKLPQEGRHSRLFLFDNSGING